MGRRLILLIVMVALVTSAHGQGDLDLPVSPKTWDKWKLGKAGQAPPPGPPRALEPFQDGPEYAPGTIPLYGEALPVGDSVVFVLDKSSSMDYPSYAGGEETRWEKLQREVSLAIMALEPNQRFSIVEFTCSHRLLWRKMRNATQSNKSLAISWLMQLEPSWSTGTGPAVVSGLFFRPDSVILVTDGEPNCRLQPGEHRDMIRMANPGIRIDVIGIGVFRYTRAWCQQIAAQNGGIYVDGG